jgi:PilZ domain
MLARKSFGKLGNRAVPRLSTEIDAGLTLPERRVACVVENVSRKGCRLRSAEPPRVGSTALVRIERVEALGTVVWVRNGRCGITFASPMPMESVERIRWIAEHASEHERNALASATAVWR